MLLKCECDLSGNAQGEAGTYTNTNTCAHKKTKNIFRGPNLPGPDLPKTKQPKIANICSNFSLVVLASWKHDEQIQVWNLREDDIEKRDHKTDCTMLYTKGEPAISRNESLLFPSPNFENRIHFISFPSQFAISHICIWESKAN